MKKVIIIDYKLGNLFSVNQSLRNIGLDIKISSDPIDIQHADAIVLPGVGAFKDAMDNLTQLDMVSHLKNAIEIDKKPFLGICLGLQLLFTESEEFGSSYGLDIVKGRVKKIEKVDPKGNKLKIPHIAWNNIFQPEGRSWNGSPLEDIPDGKDMYFVHSYYIEPLDKTIVLSETSYGNFTYASSIYRQNVFACQFHPEKSAEDGLKIYKNWAIQNNLI